MTFAQAVRKVTFEAYNRQTVGYGNIYFGKGDNYMLLRVKAPAEGYYIVEMNIVAYSKPFTVRTGGTVSTISSPDNKKLTFFVQLKAGTTEIEVASKTQWSFSNAQITLLKK